MMQPHFSAHVVSPFQEEPKLKGLSIPAMMEGMRTTLDIDPDILEAAREISARTNRTAGQVISDLARKALSSEAPGDEPAIKRNGFEIIPAGGRVITSDFIRKLMDESDGQ